MNQEKKIKKWHWGFLAILVLAFVFLQFWKYHWSEAKIELKGQELKVLVAKAFYQQKKGLGGRDSLGEYDGMLFVYAFPAKQGIVMREMKFPIDIVWFNKGEVVDIAPNVPVENVSEQELTVYYPRQPANLILELPAGWVEEKGLKIGDRLKIINHKS